VKKLWFQLHWFVGITAGTVLMVIGLTGAALAFREQILDALNPGVRNVAVQSAPVLGRSNHAGGAAKPHERITSIMLYDTPGSSARASVLRRRRASARAKRFISIPTPARCCRNWRARISLNGSNSCTASCCCRAIRARWSAARWRSA
jgi:uncharacterized iron-regulated membrane protein